MQIFIVSLAFALSTQKAQNFAVYLEKGMRASKKMNAIFVGRNAMRALEMRLQIGEKLSQRYRERGSTHKKKKKKLPTPLCGKNRGEKINSTFRSSSESLCVLLKKKVLRDREKFMRQ